MNTIRVERPPILDEATRVACAAWLAERPLSIQHILRDYPPGTRLIVETTSVYYVLGASEAGELLISRTNPAVDYDKAFDTTERIDLACIEEAIKRGQA